MKNLNLLIVEGNIQEENDNFKKKGIPNHAESLKESLSYYSSDLNIDVFNPCSELSFDKVLANIKKYDGFIAIGCIIKGETANFDLISSAITNGIMKISTNKKKPIGNAILTCFNEHQAKNRFDKGCEAAKSVITVLNND